MTETSAPAARSALVIVSGYYNAYTGAPCHLVVSGEFATPDAAAQYVARFPKSVGLRAGCHADGTGRVHLNVTLHENGANGGRNETGIKRYRSFRRNAAKLDVAVSYGGAGHVERKHAGNEYATETELHAAIEN